MANELLRLGVPKEDIVLPAFLTNCAIAILSRTC
jgi:hypothetical protein